MRDSTIDSASPIRTAHEEKEFTMNMILAPITSDDRETIIDIFNYYVENTFAAYPEEKVTYEFFDVLLGMCQGYPLICFHNPSL